MLVVGDLVEVRSPTQPVRARCGSISCCTVRAVPASRARLRARRPARASVAATPSRARPRSAARRRGLGDPRLAQVRGDRGGRRVVEHQRRRQPQAGRLAKPVAQLDRGQRVEAELLEGALGSTASGVAWPSTAATASRTRSSTELVPVAPSASRGEPLGRATRRRAAAARRAAADQAAQQRRQHGRHRGLAARSAARSRLHRHQRPARPAPSAASNSVEPPRRSSGASPMRAQPGAGRARSAAGHAGRSAHRPQASDVAGSPAARRCCGERVEEGVGRRVVGLARRCRARRPTEENSTNAARSSSAVSSCRCSAASTLGRSTRSSRSGVSDAIDAVVEHAGGVHHRGQRVLDRAGEQLASASRSATSQAATRASQPSLASSADELVGAGGVRAAAADQQQVAHAVLDQVPGDQRAERAGAAGDEHGAVGVELGAGSRRWRGRQPRHEQRPAADRDCGSSAASAARQPATSPPSMSTSTNRPGCSACAERTRPHTAARRRSGASPSPTATAPRVTIASRAPVEPLVGQPALQQRERAAWPWRAAARARSVGVDGDRVRSRRRPRRPRPRSAAPRHARPSRRRSAAGDCGACQGAPLDGNSASRPRRAPQLPASTPRCASDGDRDDGPAGLVDRGDRPAPLRPRGAPARGRAAPAA